WSAFLHQEAADLACLLVDGPHHHYVSKTAVADPTLGAIQDIAVAYAARSGHDVGSVRADPRFGEGERPDLLQSSHCGKPFLALPSGAKHVDRPHGKARGHAEESGDAAVGAG